MNTASLLKNSPFARISGTGQYALLTGECESVAARIRKTGRKEILEEGDRRRRNTWTPSAAQLNDNRFLIFAEDAAEGVGDFADGGVGLDGGEDGGKEIFCGGGAAL